MASVSEVYPRVTTMMMYLFVTGVLSSGKSAIHVASIQIVTLAGAV